MHSMRREQELDRTTAAWRRPVRSRPLSTSEQRALFNRLRLTDTTEEERSLLRRRLVFANLPIVEKCLLKVRRREVPDELLQEGALALAGAVESFVRHERRDFVRFATVRVGKRLERVATERARRQKLFARSSSESFDIVDEADPFTLTSQVERADSLETLLNALPELQNRVIRLRFGIGVREAWSRELVGKALHLELQRVGYLEERALVALRRRATRDRERRCVEMSLEWNARRGK